MPNMATRLGGAAASSAEAEHRARTAPPIVVHRSPPARRDRGEPLVSTHLDRRVGEVSLQGWFNVRGVRGFPVTALRERTGSPVAGRAVRTLGDEERVNRTTSPRPSNLFGADVDSGHEKLPGGGHVAAR